MRVEEFSLKNYITVTHTVYRKDVKLPVQMQRAMAAEAEAGREAKGKIVAAEGELKASQALKEASDIMSNNPLTLQVSYPSSLILRHMI